jgi:hypothetical protein
MAPDAPSPCSVTEEDAVHVYEQLRQRALENPAQSDGQLGRAVLATRGMAAWLLALPSIAPIEGRRKPPMHCACGKELERDKTAFVQILTNMALAVAR